MRFWSACALVLLLTSCHPKSSVLEPVITYDPPQHLIETLPSAFPPLIPEEKGQEWGKELLIAEQFARDLDLYRAITTFKRARILLPGEYLKRRLQIDYGIIQCYYLGNKWCELLETFEKSPLSDAPGTFPAMGDLLLMLHEAYQKTGQEPLASSIHQLIGRHHEKTANEIAVANAISYGDLYALSSLAPTFVDEYLFSAKSVRKAQWLNAIVPGAGFYYVGQRKSAITSFMINAAFIASTYHFFKQGNTGAALITLSLEAGWYIGGINGAGLAAKEYNEWIYNHMGNKKMQDEHLFPVLMFRTAF